jgi:hypothetical protein
VLCHEQLNHNHISVGKRDLIAIATTSGTRTALVGNDTIVSSTEEGAKSMANKRYIAAQHYGWIGHKSSSGFSDLAPSILHYNWF